MAIRSIRNNNPGNIMAGDPWRGLMARADMDAAQRAETRFCVFAKPKWGFRAMAIVLMAYQDRHALTSIAAMIDRWAPPHENDTAGYIGQVARTLGVGRGDAVDVQDYRVMRPLVEAIARVESGGEFPWPDAEVDEGLKLAGIVRPLPAAARDPAVIGGAGLSVAGVAAVAGEISDLLDSSRPLAESAARIAPWLGGAVSLALVGLVVWRLVLQRRAIER